MSRFPTDDVTLAMLEAACLPDDEGQTHLMDFLGFGSEELAPYEHYDTESGETWVFKLKAGGYHPTEAILALIAEVRRLRAQPPAASGEGSDRG